MSHPSSSPVGRSLADSIAFIRANTRAAPVAALDPIKLWTADELTPIWEATETDLQRNNIAPPFWAFAWAGGQAVSRYLLDHPETVRGKRVLDLACGSGLVAIAAAIAGAAQATANDIDPMCEAAVAANADLNHIDILWRGDDLLGADASGLDAMAIDLILAGDVFYEQEMAKRFLGFMRRAHEAGVRVIVGDPGRSYFPREAFTLLAEYEVATTTEIENRPLKSARVWTL